MKRFKKISFALVLFFLFVIATAFLVKFIFYSRDSDPYKTFLAPRLVDAEIIITQLTKEKTEMIFKAFVKNPLPFAFRADSISYGFYINGQQVMESFLHDEFRLRKNDSTWLSFPISVNNAKLKTILKS